MEDIMEQEEEFITDPVDELVNRRIGIQCPNCKDKLFPTSFNKEAVNCTCGITYILGGKHLQYRVGVPYCSADARVVSEVIIPEPEDDQLSQDIAEELGEIVNDGATQLDEIIDREPLEENFVPDLPETEQNLN